jgi:hypothetical protein
MSGTPRHTRPLYPAAAASAASPAPYRGTRQSMAYAGNEMGSPDAASYESMAAAAASYPAAAGGANERKDHIQVHVRVRPSVEGHQESTNGTEMCAIADDDGVSLSTSRPGATTRHDTFDGVFSPNATQKQVYEKTAPRFIHAAMNGYNGTIFAYGQTGSGQYTSRGVGARARDRVARRLVRALVP